MVDTVGCGERSIGRDARRTPGRRVRDTDVNRMDFSIMHRRCETQIIFVADELRDLPEDFGKILAGLGEVGAASIGLRDGP